VFTAGRKSFTVLCDDGDKGVDCIEAVSRHDGGRIVIHMGGKYVVNGGSAPKSTEIRELIFNAGRTLRCLGGAENNE